MRSSSGWTPASSLPQKLFATAKISAYLICKCSFPIDLQDRETLGPSATVPGILPPATGGGVDYSDIVFKLQDCSRRAVLLNEGSNQILLFPCYVWSVYSAIYSVKMMEMSED